MATDPPKTGDDETPPGARAEADAAPPPAGSTEAVPAAPTADGRPSLDVESPPNPRPPPERRPESPTDEYEDPEERIEELKAQVSSLRAQLDPVLHVRRRFGYGLIVATFAGAAGLVIATLCQMPTLSAAWTSEEVHTEALILLTLAHVGVTVAAVFLLLRVLATGERLALPRSLWRHADRMLGRSQPGTHAMRRMLRELADLIGRMRPPPL